MKLSDRLQMLADQIRPGETMADIGTDHGFLPIYLTEQGISPHVILTDVSKGSLEKALADCKDYDSSRVFDLRWGDGLSVLSHGEVDVVVIAGMGGILISEILERDPAMTCSFDRFLLQPRNHAGILRYRLACLGLVIEKELLVQERKRICEILVVVRSKAEIPVPYEETPWLYDYPHTLVEQAGPLTVPYLEEALAKQQRNLRGLQSARQIDTAALSRTKQTAAHLQALIEEVKREEI